MIRSLIFILILSFNLPAFSFDHKYDLWKRVVSNYVNYETNPVSVDYLGIKNSRLDFTENLRQLVKVSKEEYKGFSIDQRKAFILNLYGALAIKAVLDQIDGKTLPNSIKDASTFFNDIFNHKFFKLFGQKRNLNYLENDLAQEFKSDFKFMLAFACTAKGCPPPGFYTADNFDKALNSVMKYFLSFDKNVKFSSAVNLFEANEYIQLREKYIRNSKEYLNLKDFLIRNTPITELQRDKALKNENNLDIEFIKMDWSLNKKD